MSYGIMCHLVDIDTLKSACGSKDPALLTSINAKFADVIEENADWFDEEIAGGASLFTDVKLSLWSSH